MAGVVTSTASSASRRAKSKSQRVCGSPGRAASSRNLPRTSDDTSCPGHAALLCVMSYFSPPPFIFFLPNRLYTQRKPRAGSWRGINWLSSTSLQGVSQFTQAWPSQSPYSSPAPSNNSSLCWSPRELGCSTGFFLQR